MATFDDLPPEMVCTVLRQLSLGELTADKRVCKRWNELISSGIKVSRLFVDKKRKRPSTGRKWYSNETNETVNEDLELCHPNLFALQCQTAILSRLKCLCINCELPHFDLNQLNSFDELRHLEINHLAGSFNLKLLNLEVLSFSWINVEARLYLECPNLQCLHYDEDSSVDLLEIRYPESVRTLNGSFHSNFLARLSKFTNVEHLKSRSHLVLSEAVLLSLPKLKVLSYTDSVCKLLYSDGFALPQFGDQVKRILRTFLAKKRQLRRFDLKVVLADIVLTEEVVERMDLSVINYSRISQFDSKMVSNEHLYLSCYDDLDEGRTELFRDLHYDLLMEVVSEIPPDFFQRFPSISYLISGRRPIQDPQHLGWLVNNLNGLRVLKLHSNNGNLTQEFYDELAVPSLNSFELEETGKQVELDFGFIANFKHLTIFSINQDLRLFSVVSLICSLEHLEQLDSGGFKFTNGKWFKIKRQASSGKYDLYEDFQKLRINNAELGKIVNYFWMLVFPGSDGLNF